MVSPSDQRFELDERQIAERIKEHIKSKNFPGYYHIIMLRNGQILDIVDYPNMIKAGKITPQDAYVRIGIGLAPSRSAFHYPFLFWYNDLLDAYLSKLGFYNFSEYYIAPATGLKYVAFAVRYENYLAIEVSSLDTVVNNLNLPKIVFEVLDGKLVSGEKELTANEHDKILDMFKSQRLFAGYNVGKAWDIIINYYDEDNRSLTKEAARIAIDYDRIFNPYRVCYETRTWKEIDCWTIKLD